MTGYDPHFFWEDEQVEWQGKKSLVLGAGRSGLAAGRKLQRLGAEVFLVDSQEAEKLAGVGDLKLDSAHLWLGKQPVWQEIDPDIVILSPGVPPQQPLVASALTQGVPVWSEVELALHDCRAVRIGITGTNGKTTTTRLVGELVRRTEKEVTVAGNIGIALSGQVEHLNEQGIVVAEVSSFQLEFVDHLRFNIAILLNITPDHLDRHGTVENYRAAKARIFQNQQPADLAILNWDDPLVRSLGPELSSRVLYFSPTTFLAEGLSMRDDMLVYADKRGVTEVLSRHELQLRGVHNLENVLASIGAARELGLSWDEIAQGLREFQGVEHRQEVVGKYEGILFVNDSKGTNPDAAIKALRAFDEPLVLIAGGKNKGLAFNEFMEAAQTRVKSLILLGQAAAEMERAAQEAGIKRIIRVADYTEGVETAILEAGPGDVVLLSPACTSWDMFKSYEERGELFKELVRRHYREPI